MLGDTIVEQEGREIFELEEEIRKFEAWHWRAAFCSHQLRCCRSAKG